MDSPFFSVIIPAYNPGTHLAQAVQSVVEQTFSDWELIVIDDGSRPEEAESIRQTVEAVQRQLSPEKIRFFQQENQGVSATRNFGMEEARGSWLAFLDNDDLWKPAMLEKQYSMLREKPHLAMCHTNFDIIDESGQVTNPGYGGAADYLQYLAGSFPILPCNCVVSKAAALRVGGFDPLYPMAQDLDFYLKIHARNEVGYIADDLASYRIHSDNASRTYRSVYREITHILRKHLLLGLHQGRADVVAAARKGTKRIKSTYSGKGFDQSRAHLKERDWRAFLSHLGYAFWLHPAFVVKQFKDFVAAKASRS